MKKVLIFGHQNPDADSVLAAINLVTLKNKLGMSAEARILDNINNETKFILDFFKVAKPKFLNDVKLQVSDVQFQKEISCKVDCSIKEAFSYMKEKQIDLLPLSKKNKVDYIITLNAITDFLINPTNELNSSFVNIQNVLAGEKITCFKKEVNGTIISAAYHSDTFIDKVKLSNKHILIVGDRPKIQEFAIKNQVALLILTNNQSLDSKLLSLAKKQQINIISTPYDSYTVAKSLTLANFAKILDQKSNVPIFNQDDYLNDFIRSANNHPFHSFPVVNNQGSLLGIISKNDLNKKEAKQVILVDHNESSQSVIGLDEANILEIIDHHKMGELSVSYPINIRNMIIGSTNSIIYLLFKENNITIPKLTAGLLLAGIISDTLNLQSPTTTELDKKIIKDLEKITKLNSNDLAKKMFAAASNIKHLSNEEVFYHDFKSFISKDYLIGLGQLKTTNVLNVKNKFNEFNKFIENEAKVKKYDILILQITDIINNGSYIIFNKKAEDILKNAFNLEKINNGVFLENKVSRKLQIIPKIIKEIEKR